MARRRGEFDAIVTAPVQKSVINDAGIPFTGHTEYLAERTRTPLPVMMLATEDLRVALATTHLPLKDVSAAITVESLSHVLSILDHDLRQWWGLSAPRIAVCGLNPHAGENGHLGTEEINVIAPAIARMRERGMNAIRARTRRHRLPAGATRRVRRRARDVPRPGIAGDQTLGLRSRGERDVGAADPAHVGRSRHRARSRWHRQGGPPQPRRRYPRSRPEHPPALVRARKRFGQHFLHDPGVLQKIVCAISPETGGSRRRDRSGSRSADARTAGGGAGVTEGGATLDIIEIDRDLLRCCATSSPAIPASRFMKPTRSTSISRTLRASAADDCASSATCRTTSPRRCCSTCSISADSIEDMHIMLQREVVDRIAAAPGSGDYGRLTVMLAPRVGCRVLV